MTSRVESASLRSAIDLVRASPFPSLLMWGPDLVVRAVNEAYRPLLGAKPDPVGRPMRETWPEAWDVIGPQLRRAMTGETLSFEAARFELMRGPGAAPEEAWFDYGFSPVRDEGGRVAGVLNVAVEQTARLRAEARARADAERVRLALDAGAIIGTWFWDLPTDRFTVDEQFARAFGIDPAYGREGLSLAQVIETVHPDDVAGLQAAIAEAIARGGAYAHQYRVRRADGHHYGIEANGRVDHGPDGTPQSFPGVLLDVEDRRRREAELRRKTAELEALVSSAPLGTGFFDADHRCLRLNADLASVTGRPAGALVGRPLAEVLPGLDAAVAPLIERAFADGETTRGVEMSDGNGATWLASGFPVRDAEDEVVSAGVWLVDIAAQKRAEARAVAEEARLSAVLDAMSVGVVIADARGRLLRWNAAHTALWGAGPEAETEDWEGYGEWVGRWPDTGARLEAQDWALARAIVDGETVRGELVEIEAFGAGERRFVLMNAAPIRGPDGTILGGVLAQQDVSDLRGVQEALSEALEAKEALLLEVNHRVKNNLQVVTSLLSMQAGQSASAEVKRDLADARARIDVISAIHRSLYATGAHDAVEMVGFLRTLAEGTVGAMGGAGVRLELRGGGEAPLSLERAMPLALIVSELLTNALKYGTPGGQGTVVLTVEAEGDALRVTVADDGPGLPKGFDLSRPAGMGTKILAALGRQIRAELTPLPAERGAAFGIVLRTK